jgi:hypothetical protein
MILDTTLYKHHALLPNLVKIAQEDLHTFLISNDHTNLADWNWHNDFIGEQIYQGEVENWFTLPVVRARKFIPEWQTQLPNLAVAAKTLPGVINFTLNALAPQSHIMPHSDVDHDMNPQFVKTDRAYVILLCVEIPAGDTNMKIGDAVIHPKTGDVIGFDGHVTHAARNATDKWRYTVNIDLSADEWNI